MKRGEEERPHGTRTVRESRVKRGSSGIPLESASMHAWMDGWEN